MSKPINDKISWDIAMFKKDFNLVMNFLIKKQKETLKSKDNVTIRSIRRITN